MYEYHSCLCVGTSCTHHLQKQSICYQNESVCKEYPYTYPTAHSPIVNRFLNMKLSPNNTSLLAPGPRGLDVLRQHTRLPRHGGSLEAELCRRDED